MLYNPLTDEATTAGKFALSDDSRTAPVGGAVRGAIQTATAAPSRTTTAAAIGARTRRSGRGGGATGLPTSIEPACTGDVTRTSASSNWPRLGKALA